MLKRIISLLLCLAMVISMVPTQALATDDMGEKITEPILETEHVAESTASTEEEAEPTAESTVPTEAETESAEETIAPTEAVTEPTEEVTAPTEETIAGEQKVIPVESVTISQVEGITELAVGETLQLVATVLPENATDKTVTWSSSDESVATVDQNGVVTAVSKGRISCMASCADTVDQYNINVTDLESD